MASYVTVLHILAVVEYLSFGQEGRISSWHNISFSIEEIEEERQEGEEERQEGGVAVEAGEVFTPEILLNEAEVSVYLLITFHAQY